MKFSCTLNSVQSIPRHVEDKVSVPVVLCLSTLCLVVNRDVFLRAGSGREGEDKIEVQDSNSWDKT